MLACHVTCRAMPRHDVSHTLEIARDATCVCVPHSCAHVAASSKRRTRRSHRGRSATTRVLQSGYRRPPRHDACFIWGFADYNFTNYTLNSHI